MSTRSPQPTRTSLYEYIASDEKQLVIPVYQRNYSWIAEEQVKRLLDDILSLSEGVTKSHFTGMFFSVEIQKAFRFYEVQLVDGQQRLTTIFLILWALKTIYPEDSNIDLVDKLLFNRDTIRRDFGENYSLKLKPLVGDNNVYEKIAKGFRKQSFNDEEKESVVYKNFEYIMRYINDRPFVTVASILQALEKMEIVSIPLDPVTDNPQQVFESINDLGLHLTSLDLIRNLVLMGIESDAQEKLYYEHWRPIEDVFSQRDRSAVSDLMRLWVAIRTFSLMKNEEVYSGFKGIWKSVPDTSEGREALLDEITLYARTYKELYYEIDFFPTRDEKNKQILRDFRELGLFTVAPFVLEMYVLYKNSEVDETSFFKILNLMNTYILRRECAGMPLNDASRFFPQLLKNVKNELSGDYTTVYNTTLKFLVNVNRNNTLGLPTDEQVKNHLSLLNFYKLSHSKLILCRLENANNATPIIDLDSLSIEHIMPQHEDDNGYWETIVGDEKENYDVHCNKIGNLTMVSIKDNSAMKNSSFDKKKEYLAQSKHIKLNEYVLSKDKWNVDEITIRTELMIDAINNEFKYVKAKIDDELSYPIVFKKTNKGELLEVPAKMNKGGQVEITSDVTLRYKFKEDREYPDIVKKSLSKGWLRIGEDNSVTLQSYSKFNNIEEATEAILGQMPKYYLGLWSSRDGISIENLISLFGKE